MDPQAEITVCCSTIVLPVSILNWWWHVNWLHIRPDKCTRKKTSGITTLSCNERSIRLRPWMTSESSEVQNCSWRISTPLKYFHVSSSCHGFLPLVVRPMMTKHKMILKNLFSRIQSLHRRLEVDFHDEDESVSSTLLFGERIFLWFNIGRSSFPDGYSSCGWAGRSTSL